MLPGAHAHHRQLPAAVCNLILAAPGIFRHKKTCHQETFIMANLAHLRLAEHSLNAPLILVGFYM